MIEFEPYDRINPVTGTIGILGICLNGATGEGFEPIRCLQPFEPSLSRQLNHQIETGGVCECPEIPVSRPQRDPVIDAALSDQRVAQARFSALC